jgi:hypothetical protein
MMEGWLDRFFDRWVARCGSQGDGFPLRERAARALARPEVQTTAQIRATLQVVLGADERLWRLVPEVMDDLTGDARVPPPVVSSPSAAEWPVAVSAAAAPPVSRLVATGPAWAGTRPGSPARMKSPWIWFIALLSLGGPLTLWTRSSPQHVSTVPDPPARADAGVAAPPARPSTTAVRPVVSSRPVRWWWPLCLGAAGLGAVAVGLTLSRRAFPVKRARRRAESKRRGEVLSRGLMDATAIALPRRRMAALDLRRTVDQSSRRAGFFTPVVRAAGSFSGAGHLGLLDLRSFGAWQPEPPEQQIATTVWHSLALELTRRHVQVARVNRPLPGGLTIAFGDLRAMAATPAGRARLDALAAERGVLFLDAHHGALAGDAHGELPGNIVGLDLETLLEAIERWWAGKQRLAFDPGAPVDGLGEAYDLAAACALYGPCDLETINALRIEVNELTSASHPYASIQRVLAMPGAFWREGLLRIRAAETEALIAGMDDTLRAHVLRLRYLWSLKTIHHQLEATEPSTAERVDMRQDARALLELMRADPQFPVDRAVADQLLADVEAQVLDEDERGYVQGELTQLSSLPRGDRQINTRVEGMRAGKVRGRLRTGSLAGRTKRKLVAPDVYALLALLVFIPGALLGRSDARPNEPSVECPPGRLLCGEGCVDSSNDAAHCGRCGNLCGPGGRCYQGKCVVAAAAVPRPPADARGPDVPLVTRPRFDLFEVSEDGGRTWRSGVFGELISPTASIRVRANGLERTPVIEEDEAVADYSDALATVCVQNAPVRPRAWLEMGGRRVGQVPPGERLCVPARPGRVVCQLRWGEFSRRWDLDLRAGEEREVLDDDTGRRRARVETALADTAVEVVGVGKAQAQPSRPATFSLPGTGTYTVRCRARNRPLHALKFTITDRLEQTVTCYVGVLEVLSGDGSLTGERAAVIAAGAAPAGESRRLCTMPCRLSVPAGVYYALPESDLADRSSHVEAARQTLQDGGLAAIDLRRRRTCTLEVLTDGTRTDDVGTAVLEGRTAKVRLQTGDGRGSAQEVTCSNPGSPLKVVHYFFATVAFKAARTAVVEFSSNGSKPIQCLTSEPCRLPTGERYEWRARTSDRSGPRGELDVTPERSSLEIVLTEPAPPPDVHPAPDVPEQRPPAVVAAASGTRLMFILPSSVSPDVDGRELLTEARNDLAAAAARFGKPALAEEKKEEVIALQGHIRVIEGRFVPDEAGNGQVYEASAVVEVTLFRGLDRVVTATGSGRAQVKTVVRAVPSSSSDPAVNARREAVRNATEAAVRDLPRLTSASAE